MGTGYPAPRSRSYGGVGGRGTHITAALVGDSHMARHFDGSLPLTSMTALGQWNWANATIGAPFVFRNFGWSGDVIASIAARCSAIPRSVQVVILNMGTNDMLAVSTGASAGTVTAAVASAMAVVSPLVSGLVARGHRVILSTVYPNNALTPNTDARISYLNQLNAAYLTLHNGSTVFVVDSFAALRDGAALDLGTATANYLDAGGTHLTNLGAQVAGAASQSALRAVAALCTQDVDIYDGYNLTRGLYSQLRTGTGGTAGLMTGGSTGTIADGWRWLATSSTAALTNVTADALPSAYINIPDAFSGTRTQVMTVSAAAGTFEFRNYTDLLSSAGGLEGVLAGGNIFSEFDVELVSPNSVVDVYTETTVYTGLGTSPVDQGYSALSGSAVKSYGLRGNVFSSPQKSISAFRGVLRTPVLRIPENVSLSQTLTGSCSVWVTATGTFEVRISAPRIYTQHYARQ